MRKIRLFYSFLWLVFILLSAYVFTFFPGTKTIPNKLGPFQLYAIMITMGAIFAYLAALLLGPVKGIEEELIDKFAFSCHTFWLSGSAAWICLAKR